MRGGVSHSWVERGVAGVTDSETLAAMGVTEPIPVIVRQPGLRESVAALASYNYRLYFASQLFANTGGWMQRVAIDWLVLELTGSVALVGITVALQFAPTLLIGPWAGVLSDRVSRRGVLITTQSIGVVVNSALALLVLSGVVEAWHVLVAATILGFSTAFDAPSRSAFVSQMVGSHRLPNAISLNSSVFHLGGLLGPAISGIMIVVIGSGWSIAINAATSAVAVAALVAMRSGELTSVPRQERARGQIREALRYSTKKPTILWPIILLGFVSVFGMNLPVLLAAAADQTYESGAAGYGLYCSLTALGAFVGAILSYYRRSLRLRTIVASAATYGLVTVAAGIAPWYGLFLAALVGLGVSRLLFATAAESLTQLSTNPALRGRVMSFYLMVVIGGQAIGGVLMGWIAEHGGTGAAFVVAGGVPAVAAVASGILIARERDLRLTVNPRSLWSPLRVVPGALSRGPGPGNSGKRRRTPSWSRLRQTDQPM